MYRFGSLLLFSLMLVSLADGSQEKIKPPAETKKTPGYLPKYVVARVEMRDGTAFLGRFRMADTVVIRTENLGSLTLRFDTVRFLDLEGNVHRIATHAPETFYGLIQTDPFTIKVLAADREMKIPRTALKRLIFPDLPREPGVP